MPGLLDAELPIAAAPMAGGPSGPTLVHAVAGTGAFAFLAAGYKTPQAMRDEIGAARSSRTFGVNLFVPQRAHQIDLGSFIAYAEELAEEAAALGVRLDLDPVDDDDAWHDKLAVLTADPVPVVSLTFGLPPRRDIAALRKAGSTVLATVTAPDEARAAEAAGVDGLVVQGPRAGGHSAVFDPTVIPGNQPTVEILQAVRAVTTLPLVAAGGVDGPRAVAELLRAGAETVAVGTLLLGAHEAGTSSTHRAALADPGFTETVVTRAFTGRPARALRNDFVDRHGAVAPTGYPAIHHLTRELRATAAAANDPHRLHLWAGTGYRAATSRPAATIVRDLVDGR